MDVEWDHPKQPQHPWSVSQRQCEATQRKSLCCLTPYLRGHEKSRSGFPWPRRYGSAVRWQNHKTSDVLVAQWAYKEVPQITNWRAPKIAIESCLLVPQLSDAIRPYHTSWKLRPHLKVHLTGGLRGAAWFLPLNDQTSTCQRPRRSRTATAILCV